MPARRSGRSTGVVAPPLGQAVALQLILSARLRDLTSASVRKPGSSLPALPEPLLLVAPISSVDDITDDVTDDVIAGSGGEEPSSLMSYRLAPQLSYPVAVVVAVNMYYCYYIYIYIYIYIYTYYIYI